MPKIAQVCPFCNTGHTIWMAELANHHCICPNCHTILKIKPINNQGINMKEVRIRHRNDVKITEISFVSGKWLNWKKDYQPIIDLIKSQIPVSARIYNTDTKIWEIASEYWPPLEQVLISLNFIITKVAESTSANEPNVHVPEEYVKNFYHTPEPIRIEEDKDTIAQKLSKLLGMPVDIIFNDIELKKLYRKKAREYHPDFGGDAAKMSELNRLYSIYTSKGI